MNGNREPAGFWGGARTHMASSGPVKLLLVSVLQHAVHHAAALPHIEQRLPVLVAQLLPRGWATFRCWWKQPNSSRFYFSFFMFLTDGTGNSQWSRRTCQSRGCRSGRSEAGCTRSTRCFWPAPAAARSTRRPAGFGSLPCWAPEMQKLKREGDLYMHKHTNKKKKKHKPKFHWKNIISNSNIVFPVGITSWNHPALTCDKYSWIHHYTVPQWRSY